MKGKEYHPSVRELDCCIMCVWTLLVSLDIQSKRTHRKCNSLYILKEGAYKSSAEASLIALDKSLSEIKSVRDDVSP